jgi:hypothetical protein
LSLRWALEDYEQIVPFQPLKIRGMIFKKEKQIDEANKKTWSWHLILRKVDKRCNVAKYAVYRKTKKFPSSIVEFSLEIDFSVKRLAKGLCSFDND